MKQPNYILHSDAVCELPLSSLNSANHSIHPSQCIWNEYFCRDERNERQLDVFYRNAKTNSKTSGNLFTFDGSFEHELAQSFTQSNSHILLLPNKAALSHVYTNQQSAMLFLKSGKNEFLREQGIITARVRAVAHASGTLFAGLSVLHLLVDQLLKKTKPEQPTTVALEKMCLGARNFSIAASADITKNIAKSLGLNRFGRSKFIVVEQSQDQQRVRWQGASLEAAFDWVTEQLSQQTLLVPFVQCSTFQRTELALADSVSKYCQARAIEYHTTLPSLTAMLSFGQNVTNIGWVQLD